MFYKGIGPNRGEVVSEEEAFDYAITALASDHIGIKKEFVEWYFSGNWIRTNEEEDEE